MVEADASFGGAEDEKADDERDRVQSRGEHRNRLRVHAQETSRRTEAKRDGVVRHHRYHQQVPERHEDDEEEERGPVAQILRGDVANRDAIALGVRERMPHGLSS